MYLSSIPGRCNFVLTTFTAPVSLSDGPFFDYRYVGGLIEVFLWGWGSNMNKGYNFFPNAVYSPATPNHVRCCVLNVSHLLGSYARVEVGCDHSGRLPVSPGVLARSACRALQILSLFLLVGTWTRWHPNGFQRRPSPRHCNLHLQHYYSTFTPPGTVTHHPFCRHSACSRHSLGP